MSTHTHTHKRYEMVGNRKEEEKSMGLRYGRKRLEDGLKEDWISLLLIRRHMKKDEAKKKEKNK